MTRIDLNSDLGESYGRWRLGDDETMLDIVTSANVACGFHAGDPATLLHTCHGAAKRAVRIGAQVGYNDIGGFGRRFIEVPSADLTAEIIYQIGALDGLARAAGSSASYVKPHGALYNAIVHHREQARAVVDAVRAYDASLPVLGLPGSVFLEEAERAGLKVVAEAFADRAYTPEGTLVFRREPGAVLHDPEEVAERVLRMVTEGVVTAVDGSDIRVNAQSVCIHGDSPDATAMAVAVRRRLDAEKIDIRAFV
ncbi:MULTISPECIES: LamB/YcsF family protein [Rhodococcus]|uniref:LamB/YcsF family protein n=1 Tax=Rhodococcus TaxID=1827 RepID=UPI001E2F0710|nr:5-oxoprolinase subunit PxpA [Rhodococcus pyridinivorans]MCD2118049.1 LamB/YcsF family protein [Rhodococcus pyridinivorans]MCZ4625652.1 LamB/YcsF family protein [Rhodococcus pyridinivorans]MCZ4648127.1 LamB/YcsF family protein [Rhodococcus pyridinivorans]MDJ0481729.1 5-oxoprolinase subunit PxpA [Rhodococcus pyridinivorans]MDV7254288.1 5-oxoprolinase subunit PxpA [Rhodococcus pyridinivorans]